MPVFEQIVQPLTYSFPVREIALRLLEERFDHDLFVHAGGINTVESTAKELRLAITKEECAKVLDYIAEHQMVAITIEHVETAVYALFGNRFIEPDK
jgi:chromosomal replication initiation ATPase DnaA